MLGVPSKDESQDRQHQGDDQSIAAEPADLAVLVLDAVGKAKQGKGEICSKAHDEEPVHVTIHP